jgi:hypothetical protein
MENNLETDSKNISTTGGEKGNAFHFFLYLLMFLSLTFIAFGSGNILFELINKKFPDVLSNLSMYNATFSQSAVKFGIAALFVATPIFFGISHLISKDLFLGKIAENSPVRKWLTYIVLFFAAATVLGDLITLIIYFLDGDYTARFLLKVAVVLVISGSIFFYYFWDIRKRNIASNKFVQNKFFGISAASLILIIFILGFFVIDSPAVSREKKQDEQVIEYLVAVNYQINSYFDDNQKLPENLSILDGTKYEPNSKINFDAGFTYAKKSDNFFEVCANFKQSNRDLNGGYYNNDWRHDGGKACFQKNVIKKNTESPNSIKY